MLWIADCYHPEFVISLAILDLWWSHFRPSWWIMLKSLPVDIDSNQKLKSEIESNVTNPRWWQFAIHSIPPNNPPWLHPPFPKAILAAPCTVLAAGNSFIIRFVHGDHKRVYSHSTRWVALFQNDYNGQQAYINIQWHARHHGQRQVPFCASCVSIVLETTCTEASLAG